MIFDPALQLKGFLIGSDEENRALAAVLDVLLCFVEVVVRNEYRASAAVLKVTARR